MRRMTAVQPAWAGREARAVWFTYTPAQTGTATVDTCPSDFDTLMEIFTGACGALTSIGCNDDSSSCSGVLSGRLHLRLHGGHPLLHLGRRLQRGFRQPPDPGSPGAHSPGQRPVQRGDCPERERLLFRVHDQRQRMTVIQLVWAGRGPRACGLPIRPRRRARDGGYLPQRLRQQSRGLHRRLAAP